MKRENKDDTGWTEVTNAQSNRVKISLEKEKVETEQTMTHKTTNCCKVQTRNKAKIATLIKGQGLRISETDGR